MTSAPVSVRPFRADDVPAAGELLAARHAGHRAHEPFLDARYADPGAAADAVAGAWSQPDASGAVAERDGQLVGYLLGHPKPGHTWGPNTWVESAGFAVREPETVRDLYALAAERWVGEGRTAHYALVPSHDPALVDAWFRTGFGLQHVHAVREPAATEADPSVRLAARTDLPVLARLDLALPEHQARSPVFAVPPKATYEEALAEQEEDFGNPAFTTFVVERDGRVTGAAVGCALTMSSMHAGPAALAGAAFLGFAAVLPEDRGRGAGRALGQAVIGWAHDEGYACVVTDWRSTNLLSSRAWTALGFRPTFLRLHRLVGY